MITRQNLMYLGLSLLALLPACSSDKAPQGINAGIRPGESFVQSFPGQDVIKFRSKILFERRRAITDAAGLTPSVVTNAQPARFVDVIALNTAGVEIQTAPCATDENGRFELQVPRGTPFRVVVLASTLNSGGRANLELRDPITEQRAAVSFTDPKSGGPFSFDPRFGSAEIELPPISIAPDSTVPLVTDRPAGAFAILDACVTASEEVRAALGVSLPLLTIFWAPDTTIGSFFLPAAPPFGPSLFIKGGSSALDDTDDSDPSVITHEFGHFVSLSVLRDSSLGGAHGVGDLLYPSLAYSEGFANAFAGMIQNQAAYLDSAFVTDRPAFFALNLENRDNSIPAGSIGAQRGIRSEISIGEIAWDLVDGTGGRVDSDNDAVKIAFADYLRALASLRTQPVYVSVIDVLQALVNTGATAIGPINTLLASPVNQQITFPAAGTDIFPTRLTIPALVNDTCQTRGDNDTGNSGVAVSNRFFQVTLATQTAVTFRMTLTAAITGAGVDSENIDMIVRTVDNARAKDVAGVELTPAPGPEALVEDTGSHVLAAGTYIVEIRGRPTDAFGNFSNANGGNDIPYQLEVTSP